MITVAIDGPAGVGKSSTSRALAQHFGFAYLDTGAMYRACAWWCLNQGIDLDTAVDEQQVTEAVGDFFAGEHCVIDLDPQHPGITCDGTDISTDIRSSEVSSHVSKVSGIIPVRHVLIAAQRAYIDAERSPESFSGGRGIVVEGRDITTVVAPDAEVRVLLTAREEVRQARRTGQKLPGRGTDDVSARDKADSQVTSFLSAADGVTTLDNSDLTFEQTLAALISLVDQAIETQEYEQFAANLNEYDLNDDDRLLIEQEQDTADGSPVDSERDHGIGVLAVVGRPNVGKSTLVNRILGRRAAVVEDTPGVTRDRVSYDGEWAGTNFKLVDTGGWEADAQGLESAVAAQAQLAVQMSDAVILVVDAQVGLTATDERIVGMLRASGKPVLVAANKIDDFSAEYLAAEFWKLGLGEPYAISAMHGRGIGELLDAALGALKKSHARSGTATPEGIRRVALVGRPNVGKSSLLNQVAQQERAVVDDLAGTTRDPLDEVVTLDGQDWLFIDTAGIKRRQHALSGAEYYSSLRTQAAIERTELVLVLFDATEPVSDQDLKIMSQAVDAGRAIVLVFNKWDEVDTFDRERLERLWQTEFDQVTWAQRVNLSAKTGWHTNRLTEAMHTALDSWDKRIPTGKLNAFLGRIQAAHPHPLRGGKQARILFATQASTRPPRFVIFTTGFLEPGYRRFLERQLREEFGFEGTPLEISVHIRKRRR